MRKNIKCQGNGMTKMRLGSDVHQIRFNGGGCRAIWTRALSYSHIALMCLFTLCVWACLGNVSSVLYAANSDAGDDSILQSDATDTGVVRNVDANVTRESSKTDAEIVSCEHSPFQLKMLTDASAVSNTSEATPRDTGIDGSLSGGIQKSTTCADVLNEAGRLEICEQGVPVLVYNASEQIRENISDSRNRRACYVHPLYGLEGETLTDDFPKDHYHHHGLFWGWMHVAFDGIDSEFDNWTHPEKLRFVHQRWLRRETTADRAIIAVENGWYLNDLKSSDPNKHDPSDPFPSESLMRERITLTVYPEENGVRLIDFSGEWTPTTRAVTLRGAEGKSYGGVNVRFASHQNPVITIADGVTSEDLPIARLTWADFSAKFAAPPQESSTETKSVPSQEKSNDFTLESGVVLMISPTHPGYPPTWLTRHYGVLCVGWPGVDGQTFQPGETFKLDYSILIHRGTLSVETLRKIYADYVQEVTSQNSVTDSDENEVIDTTAKTIAE